MLQFLTNISIARRLWIAAAVSAFIPFIVISLLGSSYVNTLNTINETVQASNNAVKLATDMQADLLRMNALLATLNASPSASATNVQNGNEVGQLTSDFGSTLTNYQQNYQISTSATMKSVNNTLKNDSQGNQAPVSQHSMIFVVNIQWQVYHTVQNQVLEDVHHSANANTLAGDVASANGEYLPLKGNLDNLVGLTESISQIVAQVNTFQINPTIFWTVFALFFSTLLVFLISYVINITITRPLRQLVRLTERIAQGETEARATVNGQDEIYMVANSMNTMMNSIVDLMQNIQGQRDFLQARVEKLIGEVKGLGSGDLRSRADMTSDALGFLARSFNYMIEELSNLVIRVKMVAYEVEGLTSATQTRMLQLVDSSDRQMHDMTEAVREVEKMADSTYMVAERSQLLAALARETRLAARTGREAADQAGQGIQRIQENVQETSSKVQILGESSLQINNIVTVIANIAHQTNRLALDASVQAAMAGENGKGFAAVAVDIRRLAEQTKNQAGMIAALVRAVNANVENVAKAMHETEKETADDTKLALQAGLSLTAIFEAVEHQTQAIEGINTSLNQQLQHSRSVLNIMKNALDANRINGNSTREATQNMRKLTLMVERLRASVGAFQLRDDQRIYQTKQIQR